MAILNQFDRPIFSPADAGLHNGRIGPARIPVPHAY